MINNTQRTKECIILNSSKVKATTKSLAKRNSEVHWFVSKPKMGSTHFLRKGGRSKSVSLMACTKTRNTGTPEHTRTPEHPGTPEHRNTETQNLTVLFCFPITDTVKNKVSM